MMTMEDVHFLDSSGNDLGPVLTSADIAIGCTLGYLDFRFAHLGWRASHPQLKAWAAELLARPSFTTTAPPAA